MQFECIADVRGSLTESPVWDEKRGLLFCCDILERKVYEIDLAEGVRREWQFETDVCSLGLCESGRLVIALSHEVIFFDVETGSRELLCRMDDMPPECRLNDGKVGPDGCFWVGSMDNRDAKQPAGNLYRITSDGVVSIKARDIYVSNGLAWSPESDVFYHSDSRGPYIDYYDFDIVTGTISGRKRLTVLDDAMGRPDGGACDMEGMYWSAGVSAGVLNRISLQGEIIARYNMPVAAPTMPCFCGPDLKTIAITSHRHISAEMLMQYPLSGGVFAAQTDFAGVPVRRMKDV